MRAEEQRDARRQEFVWIDWLRAQSGVSWGAEFPVPIGDDAAVWRPKAGRALVLTVDSQVEGVHFRRAWTSPRVAGRRAVAVSISDLAAMGASPRLLLVSTVLETGTSTREFRALHAGIHEAARDYGARVVGGNLSSGPMSIHITAIGEVAPGRFLTRGGARRGDELWVSGSPGLAQLGLDYLSRGGGRGAARGDGKDRRKKPTHAAIRPALRAFREPRARVAEGLHLARCRSVGAMIDVSDGLVSDVGHVVEESSRARGHVLGAELDADALLRLPGLASASRALGADGLEAALFGGEAYELCFSATRAFAGRGARSFRLAFDTPLRRVGRLTERKGIFLRRSDGTTSELSAEAGWDHFRR